MARLRHLHALTWITAALVGSSVGRSLAEAGERLRRDTIPVDVSISHDKEANDLLTADSVDRSEPVPLEGDGPTICYQPAQPVLGPISALYNFSLTSYEQSPKDRNTPCSFNIVDNHSFGNSYGWPFVTSYEPPACHFDRVLLELNVSSEGHQFDRLGSMYLGDTEIWRTSTAEPMPSGIAWQHWKDVTPYLSLWKTPQKFVFDLGNNVNNEYTASYNVSVRALFFLASEEHTEASNLLKPADAIIPISRRRSEMVRDPMSRWHVPDDEAVDKVTFPRNVRRAVFSVTATGQSAEEFWWANVLESDKETFNGTASAGFSPFREVQLYIDEELAGVHWPFPIIFTGGVNPMLHRPVVGLYAFDLPEGEIDITPWLPILCDGYEHSFRIRVMGIDNNDKNADLMDKVNSYWVVSGKVFVWLDQDLASITTGGAPNIEAKDIDISFTNEIGKDGDDKTSLNYTVSVARTLKISNTIRTQDGEAKAQWTQDLEFFTQAELDRRGVEQVNYFLMSGVESAPLSGYRSSFSYPLNLRCDYEVDAATDGFVLNTTLYQGYDRNVTGPTVYATGLEAFNLSPGMPETTARIWTYRNGTSSLRRQARSKVSSASGGMHQLFRFDALLPEDRGGYTELYSRNMTVANGTIPYDRQAFRDGHEIIVSDPGIGGMDVEKTEFPVSRFGTPVENLRHVAELSW